MILMNRSAWHARNPISQAVDQPGALPKVYIHHTAGYYPKTVAEEITQMQTLERISLDTKGYSDITYNWLIGPTGTVYEGRGLNKKSAATNDQNDVSRSVCIMGNYQNDPYTMMIEDSIVDIIDYMVLHDNLQAANGLTILGHRENPLHLGATACPGDHIFVNLDSIRSKFYKKPPPVENVPPEITIIPDQNEEDVEIVIVIPSTADGKACNARFIGHRIIQNGAKLLTYLEWVDGNDANQLARYNRYLQFNIPTWDIGVSDLLGVTLSGAIPNGDPVHNWTRADFANVV